MGGGGGGSGIRGTSSLGLLGVGPTIYISISILWGYPYLLGLHYKEFIWDIPVLIFA